MKPLVIKNNKLALHKNLKIQTREVETTQSSSWKGHSHHFQPVLPASPARLHHRSVSHLALTASVSEASAHFPLHRLTGACTRSLLWTFCSVSIFHWKRSWDAQSFSIFQIFSRIFFLEMGFSNLDSFSIFCLQDSSLQQQKTPVSAKTVQIFTYASPQLNG